MPVNCLQKKFDFLLVKNFEEELANFKARIDSLDAKLTDIGVDLMDDPKVKKKSKKKFKEKIEDFLIENLRGKLDVKLLTIFEKNVDWMESSISGIETRLAHHFKQNGSFVLLNNPNTSHKSTNVNFFDLKPKIQKNSKNSLMFQNFQNSPTPKNVSIQHVYLKANFKTGQTFIAFKSPKDYIVSQLDKCLAIYQNDQLIHTENLENRKGKIFTLKKSISST
jgi:hypothetical protein